ncbi:MAG TPA: YibE/F family protein [Anaerolineae bacterium]|nr:YibE/F family protein [Anaerolineae bacterium]HID83929.1 YibE/F family protein [Anaerolineales bacterium]
MDDKPRTRRYWLLVLVLTGLTLAWLSTQRHPVGEIPELTYGSETVVAQVEKVLEEGTVTLGDHTQPYQVLQVRLLEGEYAGVPMQIEYAKYQTYPVVHLFRPGERLLVSLNKQPDGTLNAFYADRVRAPQLAWLGALFLAAILLISGWKGLRALLAMAYSLAVVIVYIIPHILAGEDPVRTSILGAMVLLGVTLYLTYGWTLKTHAAALSMVLSLLLTGLLAWFFVAFTQLTGYGDENALYLLQFAGATINLRGLLLGGMIIGALGVLDDLVTTQAAAVFELHAANPAQPLSHLIRRAMHIGQDHVAATVNTLVLAYAGSSLPMFLLFSLGHTPWGKLLNFEFIAEEVVRTLVGSLGLIAAVPLTTLIAAVLARNIARLGAKAAWFGPVGESHGH